MMSVLLPECLVRIIADTHQVTFEEVGTCTLRVGLIMGTVNCEFCDLHANINALKKKS